MRRRGPACVCGGGGEGTSDLARVGSGGVGGRPGGWRRVGFRAEKAREASEDLSLSFPLPSALRLLSQPALPDPRDPAGPAYPDRRDSRREVNAGERSGAECGGRGLRGERRGGAGSGRWRSRCA